MTALPAWATDPEMLLITEEGYEALPEEVQKQIEVIDGRVIFCRSGSGERNVVARRLANGFDAARPSEPRIRVLTDFEMHYREVRPRTPGFSFRRPDVVVHKCISRGEKLYTDDVLLVVEVVSPGSEYTDTVDKRAEYAAEGIPVYLVVHLDDDLRVKIIQEYRLDWASGSYRQAELHQDVLVLREPYPVKIAFGDLDT
ncbi:Uma2 family endonuclease [Nocardia sp. CDC159]|uniref:Uma2 family endonuclease n=1 Tax=Nocardia pulmonis TaxID=2951408 RepID=A0A9X2EBU5_9NOCA|nr:MULTISPECIES: Uma2 family endonuclease [Nocardia]MCM6777425.1 Uma2 family endonuclease [Nocardia pulmonis]MCM6790310.1 Uma2 family endonuclease [Nocardia sp. CDC159]